MVFMRYFLLYFVLAYLFRVILAMVTSKGPVGEAIMHTMTDPNVFFYTVILAGAVAIYSLRRKRTEGRQDQPD